MYPKIYLFLESEYSLEKHYDESDSPRIFGWWFVVVGRYWYGNGPADEGEANPSQKEAMRRIIENGVFVWPAKTLHNRPPNIAWR